MGCQMHDSIAMSNNADYLNFFIKMTRSPVWPEIIDMLLKNLESQERPDLCARVFYIKRREMMRCTLVEEIFGKVFAHVHVTEI